MSEREDLSDEERTYFREKLTQAKWAMSCVDRRAAMLMACAKKILAVQHDFFVDGVSPIKPLSDKAIAEKLSERGVSISRRTVAKYRENAMIPSTTGRRKR